MVTYYKRKCAIMFVIIILIKGDYKTCIIHDCLYSVIINLFFMHIKLQYITLMWWLLFLKVIYVICVICYKQFGTNENVICLFLELVSAFNNSILLYFLVFIIFNSKENKYLNGQKTEFFFFYLENRKQKLIR